MYKRLLAQEPFLRLLTQSSPKRRKRLLQQATKEELTVLFEICLNIFKSNIPVNNTVFKKLKRHKGILRTLDNKQLALIHMKKIVNHGKLLPVLPLLARLIK